VGFTDGDATSSVQLARDVGRHGSEISEKYYSETCDCLCEVRDALWPWPKDAHMLLDHLAMQADADAALVFRGAGRQNSQPFAPFCRATKMELFENPVPPSSSSRYCPVVGTLPFSDPTATHEFISSELISCRSLVCLVEAPMASLAIASECKCNN
jgi:hypothetical protein